MLITTTPGIEGRAVAQYLGVVTAQGVLGVNVTWTPSSLTGQVAGVCSMSGSGGQLAATSAGVR